MATPTIPPHTLEQKKKKEEEEEDIRRWHRQRVVVGVDTQTSVSRVVLH